MNIQYSSDLHLEFPENQNYLNRNPIIPAGDILLLGGDIVPLTWINKKAAFFDLISSQFKYVYWIAGNHEYYGYQMDQKCGTFKEAIRENIFLVNNCSVIHEHVRFVFTTLWTKISPLHSFTIERGMADFNHIQWQGNRFTYQLYNEQHAASIAFLKAELEKPFDGKTIVLTHHVPTLFNYPEKYKNSPLNQAFVVELSDFIETSSIDYWIFGHDHYNVPPFKIGNTTMLTNMLGYVDYGEDKLFNSSAVIVL